MSIALLATYHSFDWQEIKSKTINVVMEYKSRLTPAFFQQWTMFKKAVRRTSIAFAACVLYHQTPGLFLTALGLSTRFPHVMRESAGKIINIWNKQKLLIKIMLFLGAFLALPQTILASSILMGGYLGSKMHITSAALLAIKEYNDFVTTPLTDGQAEAFRHFLCKDRNILIYNKLYKHAKKIKVLQKRKSDHRLASLPFYRHLLKEKSCLLGKQTELLDVLDKYKDKDKGKDKYKYECTVTETIDALVLSVLS